MEDEEPATDVCASVSEDVMVEDFGTAAAEEDTVIPAKE